MGVCPCVIHDIWSTDGTQSETSLTPRPSESGVFGVEPRKRVEEGDRPYGEGASGP